MIRARAVLTVLWTLSAGCRPVATAVVRVVAVPRPLVPIVHPTAENREPAVPDVLECRLWTASYSCLQRKTIVYLDALNRLDEISLIGDLVTAVRTRPVDSRLPVLTDGLLDARGLTDVVSLSALMDTVVRNMIEIHVIRISFPRIIGL